MIDKKTFKIFGLLFLLSVAVSGTALADIALTPDEKLSLYGDVGLRFENDLAARNEDGDSVDDRFRGRIRGRLGVNYQPIDGLRFNARIRTGADDNHQSSHITVYDFSNKESSNWDGHLDRWYVEGRKDNHWIWLGRNNFPFLGNDRVLWESNATVAGLAMGTEFSVTDHSALKLRAGYVALPVGMQDFSGELAAAEILYTMDINGFTLGFGEGVFDFRADGDDPDAMKLDHGNGGRDYLIWNTSLSLSRDIQDMPVTAQFDWIHNSENYASTAADPDTAENHDRRNGYVFGLTAGEMKQAGDWQAGAAYAYVEELAINSSYTQSEWSRFSLNGFAGSNLSLGYQITDALEVVGKAFHTRALKSDEKNTRFRLEFNYAF